MPRIQVYFSDKEHEFVKSKPQGFVRELVAISMAEDGVEKKDYKSIKSGPDSVKDVFACKECGQVLCAGKCINKFCRRFKK